MTNVNLWPIIGKLQKLEQETDGRGMSLANMMRELADFREMDLHDIIRGLIEAQCEIEAADQQQAMVYEMHQAIEQEAKTA